ETQEQVGNVAPTETSNENAVVQTENKETVVTQEEEKQIKPAESGVVHQIIGGISENGPIITGVVVDNQTGSLYPTLPGTLQAANV
uniref:Uncharacterized protein n=1 Tax=Acrobeloides nanus TaxID=290746 RepID=A0A914DDS2_9BILA